MKGLIFLGIVIFLCFILYKYVLSKFKAPKVGAVAFVNGGIKTGKSFFSVYLAIKNYRRIHFKWKIVSLFRKDIEEPLLYSNIPLKVPYVPLTKELCLRIHRFNYKSVILIDDASLFADSRLSVDDKSSNTLLQKWVKLIGHETHGGLLIYDSQSIDDMHVAFRRGLSQYFYIHHLSKWIPFFCIIHLRECIYAEDGSVLNTVTEDLEKSLTRVIVPKRYFKYYDCYAFSTETDGLPHPYKCVQAKSLKADKLVSFRKEFDTTGENKNA